MTDQTIPDVTDNDRRLARKWAEGIVTGLSSPRALAAARVILDAVPTPPRPTLADMTRKERDGCRWMQADTETWGRAVILRPNANVGSALILDRWGHIAYEAHDRITPRQDLPRLEWPDTDQEEA